MARARKPISLARRLLIWYAVAVAVVVLALGVGLSGMLRAQVTADLTESLEHQARLIRLSLPVDVAQLRSAVDGWSREAGIRITVISAEGVVLADSSRDPAGMDDHSNRPEVIAALAGAVGSDTRLSDSVGIEFRYVALPPADGRIVRVAEALSAIDDRLARLRLNVALGATGAALLGLLAVGGAARRIVRPFRLATAGAAQVAEGAPVETIEPGGPLELQVMVETVQAMARELRARAGEAEQERTLRDRVLAALDEGVFLVEADDAITYTNDWARRALGHRPSLSSLPAPLQRICLEARRSGDPSRTDFTLGIPARTFVAVATPLEVTGPVVIVLQDVTISRRVEAMRRDFVADASHELKTPIAAIQAGAETIARAIGDDREAAADFAEQIHQNAVRLGRLVADLLDLSRLETEEPRFEPVPLDELVGSETERLVRPDREGRVRLTTDFDAVAVSGSASDLRLAVRNLLENAERYAAGGDVRVAVSRDGGQAVVEVADTGIGIPKRDLPRIFERFYRVDLARSRHTGGTGLGLAIVRHIAEQHGGTVSVESELGVGSTFRLRLPAIEP